MQMLKTSKKQIFIRPFWQSEAGGVQSKVEEVCSDTHSRTHTPTHTHIKRFVPSGRPWSRQNHSDFELALIGCHCSMPHTAETTQNHTHTNTHFCGLGIMFH